MGKGLTAEIALKIEEYMLPKDSETALSEVSVRRSRVVSLTTYRLGSRKICIQIANLHRITT
jgi:hypothetical protein